VPGTAPTYPSYLKKVQVLRSPSYISLQAARTYHQIIPERTHAVMCAGFCLDNKYVDDTSLGRYSCRYIPQRAFPLGILPAEAEGSGFRIERETLEDLDWDLITSKVIWVPLTAPPTVLGNHMHMSGGSKKKHGHGVNHQLTVRRRPTAVSNPSWRTAS
jgi:hypothetical protein